MNETKNNRLMNQTTMINFFCLMHLVQYYNKCISNVPTSSKIHVLGSKCYTSNITKVYNLIYIT